MIEVSVIIPARDAASRLPRVIGALAAQDIPQESFEVIVVVDEESRDRTVAVAERHQPFIRVIRRAPGEGPGAARTRGARAAAAPVLAFTDADCVPTPGWLKAGLAAIKEFDLVQGRVMPDPEVSRTPFDRTLVVDRGEGFYQTANLFVRREVFDAVGGFHDWALERPLRGRSTADRRRGLASRTPIGDDTLFGWTARRAGARPGFASAALVNHEVVPGGARDEIEERWHWTRDMPGLARAVPELRDSVFYKRWFFAAWSAQFDLAAAAMVLAALTRRVGWLLAVLPYLHRLERETRLYRDGRDSRWAGLRRAGRYALGAPAVDAATLAGFVAGSIAWRSLVL